MRALLSRSSLLAALCMLLPGLALASEEAATSLVIVADTRGLPAWQAWLANLYNAGHLQFTLFTVVTIPLVGLILGLIADFAMRRIGLDLKSRELAEH